MQPKPNPTRLLTPHPAAPRWLSLLALCLLAASPLHAQHGCFHSPEAPTDILLLAGGTGMFYGSSLLHKWLQRRRNRK